MRTLVSIIPKPVKKVILGALRSAGLDLVPKNYVQDHVPIRLRADTVVELEAMYREFVFPDLPSNADRPGLIARLEGTQASEAIYLVRYLRCSLDVQGDVCEFGVAQGATSALIANEIRSSARKLWLFDSFEGLPPPTEKDVLLHDIFQLGSIEKYAGTMAYGQAHVMRRLHGIEFSSSRFSIVPGFIERTIHRPDLPRAVCFAYVDFDFYEPIKVALEYLDGVVPAGGHVLVDDYGWFSSGAQTAVDEFLRARADRWSLALPPARAGHFAILIRVAGSS